MMKNYALLFFLFLFALPLSGLAQEGNTEGSGSGVVQEQTAELDNFKLNESVKMYPNPVLNYLTIRSDFPISRVQVFTLLGQRVKEIRSNYNRIYLGDLNSGIYMIKIYSSDYHITKKLIKR